MYEQGGYLDDRFGANCRKATVKQNLSFASRAPHLVPESSTREDRLVNKSMAKGVVIG
jgi:hypothetical protein